MVNNKAPGWKRILAELIYCSKHNLYNSEYKISFKDLVHRSFSSVTPDAQHSSFSRSYNKLIKNLQKLSSYKEIKGVSFVDVKQIDGNEKALYIDYKCLTEWAENMYQIFLKMSKNKTWASAIKRRYGRFKDFNITPLSLVVFLLLKYDKYGFPKQHQIISQIGEFLFGAVLQAKEIKDIEERYKTPKSTKENSRNPS